MKLFFKKIVVNCLIMLMIAIIVDVLLVILFYNSNYFVYKDWRLLLQGDINAEVIINGSSRAVRHVDPLIIEEETEKTTYNIGLVSEPGLTQLNRFKTYLKYNKAPETLIQVIEPSFIGSPDTIVLKEYYVPYIYEEEIYDALYRINDNVWKDKYIPLYKWHGNSSIIFESIKSLVFETEQMQKGYSPRDIDWMSQEKDSTKFKSLKIDEGAHAFNNTIDSLINFAQFCKSENIKLIMLYTPMTLEGQRVFEQNDALIIRLTELANQDYFTFWDYSRSNINKDKTLFYNHTHLNEKGAEVFSHKLASRLNKSQK